jgi:hypothetical protein
MVSQKKRIDKMLMIIRDEKVTMDALEEPVEMAVTPQVAVAGMGIE